MGCAHKGPPRVTLQKRQQPARENKIKREEPFTLPPTLWRPLTEGKRGGGLPPLYSQTDPTHTAPPGPAPSAATYTHFPTVKTPQRAGRCVGFPSDPKHSAPSKLTSPSLPPSLPPCLHSDTPTTVNALQYFCFCCCSHFWLHFSFIPPGSRS